MTVAPLPPAASDLARLIRRGIGWWVGELAQMLPRRLSGVLGADGEPVVLMTLGPGGAALWPSDLRRPSGAAVDHPRRGVTIGLDPSLVFAASIELPRTAAPSLRQILEHQIERLVPLAASETWFAYRVAPDADENLIQVRVFVAKRVTIDQALSATRTAGFSPRRVILADWRGPGKPPILWEADAATDATRTLRRRLEIAALALAALAYGLYVHRLDRVRDELAAQVAVTQPAAEAVTALARRLTAVDADARFFADRRKEAPPLQVIDALTKLVPTDSWLTGLVLDRRNVEISGYSPHASDLAALVERSPLFQSPRFGSSITLAPDGKREHFELAFETKMAPVR